MSNPFGPEIFIPDDMRCEALVRGKPGWPDWAQADHRCTKKATSLRQGFSVCWVHERKKEVQKWTGGADKFPRWPTDHQYRKSTT